MDAVCAPGPCGAQTPGAMVGKEEKIEPPERRFGGKGETATMADHVEGILITGAPHLPEDRGQQTACARTDEPRCIEVSTQVVWPLLAHLAQNAGNLQHARPFKEVIEVCDVSGQASRRAICKPGTEQGTLLCGRNARQPRVSHIA